MGPDIFLSFVKDRTWEPVPVYWTENPFQQFLAKLFFHLYRDKYANVTEIKVNITSEITPAEFLRSLYERGVISYGESMNSSVFVELNGEEPICAQKLKNGSKVIIQLRQFAVVSAPV